MSLFETMTNRTRKKQKPGKHKQAINVHMKDRPDGKVGVRYTFKPPINAETPNTPALQLGRKVIGVIKKVKNEGGESSQDSRRR